jgi:hypothetical protein
MKEEPAGSLPTYFSLFVLAFTNANRNRAARTVPTIVRAPSGTSGVTIQPQPPEEDEVADWEVVVDEVVREFWVDDEEESLFGVVCCGGGGN